MRFIDYSESIPEENLNCFTEATIEDLIDIVIMPTKIEATESNIKEQIENLSKEFDRLINIKKEK
ncbi:MAG: hypothetical protein PHC34_03120 [Candidatus Gastranaerophilales bacterium]|nr:hypothetical protein [Candidatus Gastranaerophilales bacterium]